MKVFSLAQEEQIYVIKESNEGTLEYPAITDCVLAVGVSAFGQNIELIDDAQIRDTRTRFSAIKGRVHPGDWSFTTYVKPSGALGTAPEADVLYECLAGKKKVNAGVSVVYSSDSSINMPSFSLWVKKGHTVFCMWGCTVNVGEHTVTGAEIAQVAWSGQFMRWCWAGETKLVGAAASAQADVTVKNAEKYCNQLIKVAIYNSAGTTVVDDNGGDGYIIKSIDYANNVITMTTNLLIGGSNGDTLKPWWPASCTETGRPVHGKLGICTISPKGGASPVDCKVLSAAITHTNNIKYYEDEKNGLLYADTYEAIGFRDIIGTLTLFFYKSGTKYFYRAEQQSQNALVVPAGDTAGRILSISCPRIEYRTPTLSGEEEIMMELPFVAIGESGHEDEEISYTFR